MPVAAKRPSAVFGGGGPRRQALALATQQLRGLTAWPMSLKMAPSLLRPHPMGPGAGVRNRLSPGSARVPRPPPPPAAPAALAQLQTPCLTHRPATEARPKALPSRPALASTARPYRFRDRLPPKPGDIPESICVLVRSSPRAKTETQRPAVVPTAGANSPHHGARPPPVRGHQAAGT